MVATKLVMNNKLKLLRQSRYEEVHKFFIIKYVLLTEDYDRFGNSYTFRKKNLNLNQRNPFNSTFNHGFLFATHTH